MTPDMDSLLARRWRLTDDPDVLLFATAEGTFTFWPNRIQVRNAYGTVTEEFAPETPLGKSILAGLHAKEVAALRAQEAEDDPICSICAWEKSHTRHYDTALYNYHPFAGGDNV